MANMNAQRLILVDPKCEYDLEARQGAAGAQTHLLESNRYGSMKEFLENEPDGIRFAFCARLKKETDSLDLSQRLKSIFSEPEFISTSKKRPFYLIFGPEDHGLANEEIEFAHHIVSLPTFGEFNSMNLSHAALLALYIFRDSEKTSLSGQPSTVAGETAAAIDLAGFYFPESAIKDWLGELGFDIGDRRTDAYMVFKRILLDRRASAKELRVLEAIIQQTIRKLRK
jgi:tRNA/rRNA methyltransferase